MLAFLFGSEHLRRSIVHSMSLFLFTGDTSASLESLSVVDAHRCWIVQMAWIGGHFSWSSWGFIFLSHFFYVFCDVSFILLQELWFFARFPKVWDLCPGRYGVVLNQLGSIPSFDSIQRTTTPWSVHWDTEICVKVSFKQDLWNTVHRDMSKQLLH